MEKSSSAKSLEPKASLASKLIWGIGLRPQHLRKLEDLCQSQPQAFPAILEVMSDNLLFQRGGPAILRTRRLAEKTQMVLHGIGLNIAGADDLDWAYIDELERLRKDLGGQLISDHLSFSRAGGISTFELLPIVRSKDYLRHVAERVMKIQDRWQSALVLENVSAYVEHVENEMSEGGFFTELVRLTGCGVLLDVNNLYVNSVNFGMDPFKELDQFPMAAVRQFHMAGHSVCERPNDRYLFDTHDHPADDLVIQLLSKALSKMETSLRHKPPIIVEWDDPKSDLEVVVNEMQRVRRRIERC